MGSRRAFLAAAGAGALVAARPFAAAGGNPGAGSAAAATDLKPLTGGVKDITADERQERIARLQALLAREKIGALVLEPGSSLDYFTGIQWHRSERTTAAIVPASGAVLVVCPAFEEPSVRETLQVGGDVRVWSEHESPFDLLVKGLRDRGVASGAVALEPTLRFFIVDGMRRASGAYDLVSGDALVRACRLIKSPHELALLQVANDITLQALRWAHGRVVSGMGAADLGSLVATATVALGGVPEFSLALLNEASAYPHGSRQPQTVREGSIVLMDCGCTVFGYQSDMSRTWVHGAASDGEARRAGRQGR
jgi:Xaa-Pro dipeptidase